MTALYSKVQSRVAFSVLNIYKGSSIEKELSELDARGSPKTAKVESSKLHISSLSVNINRA